jgi:hypothetical protein
VSGWEQALSIALGALVSAFVKVLPMLLEWVAKKLGVAPPSPMEQIAAVSAPERATERTEPPTGP